MPARGIRIRPEVRPATPHPRKVGLAGSAGKLTGGTAAVAAAAATELLFAQQQQQQRGLLPVQPGV